jgi:hypothetical protein
VRTRRARCRRESDISCGDLTEGNAGRSLRALTQDQPMAGSGLPWLHPVIDRIAADLDELARARRVQDLNTAAVLPDPRAERRRRLAEPDLEFRAFCTRRRLPASSTPQLERAWDAWQAERYQRGEISQRPGYTDNPFRPR